MDDRYRNKYRIPSARAPWHDYAVGTYFVTICTKNREPYFGEIVDLPNDRIMRLSDIGRRAEECWQAIPQHFPYVEIPSWVIMPNHIHGIVIINPHPCPPVETQDFASPDPTMPQDFASPDPTMPQDFASPDPTMVSEPFDFAHLRIPGITSCDDKPTENHFGPQSRNLASVIRGFKIGVTKFAREQDLAFEWQTRFHDHIVRNPKEMTYIAHYIDNNVHNWKGDCFYKELP